MNLKQAIPYLLSAFLFFLIPFSGFSQPNGGCDPQDPACPIDGGVSFLIAAGIGLAAKKAHMERNKKKLSVEENSK